MFDNSANPIVLAGPADPFCPRQIAFTLPGAPGVQVTATENGGSIDFVVDVLDTSSLTGDLRGLFFQFNEAKLSGLSLVDTDHLITASQIKANAVIDLGNGDNMQGAASPFDVGVGFGTQGIGKGDDLSGPVHFTLTDAAHDLTLDDLAHLQFGARVTSIGNPTRGGRSDSEKIVGTAPAAPDAHDDTYNNLFEDGASGLNDPSKTPHAITLNVLANDTDGDGDALTITSFHDGPSHGTVAISADGHSVLYTPNLDYAGSDSFEYCVSDGHGGQDHATVNLTLQAVADRPIVTYSVAPGADVDHLLITVSADQNDADSSEFLDKIVAGATPAGVTVSPGGADPVAQDDHLSQVFTVTTTPGQSYNFNLTFTAAAKETSNGDVETGTAVVPIVIEYKTNDADPDFKATDQSIWSSGNAFTLDDNRFLGVDTGFSDSSGGVIGYDASAHIRAGFESKLHFSGGDIDADLNYHLGVNTTYNKTTDTLEIGTSASPTGGSFLTHGPSGSYVLNFILNYDYHIAATYDVGVDSGDIFSFSGSDTNSYNILNLDSSSLSASIDFPPPFDSLSASVAWPNISVSGGPTPPPPGEVSGDGASNNFLTLNVDVDQALADIFLGGANPFDIPFDVSVAEGHIEIADLDLQGSLKLLQQFILQPTGFAATMHFEDGSSQAFSFGSDIVLQHASDIDLHGNHNGKVDFSLTLDPQATLRNNTDLGASIGYSFDLLKVTGSYDVVVDSGDINIGPLFHAGGSLPIGSLDLYDSTFALNFASQDFSYFA